MAVTALTPANWISPRRRPRRWPTATSRCGTTTAGPSAPLTRQKALIASAVDTIRFRFDVNAKRGKRFEEGELRLSPAMLALVATVGRDDDGTRCGSATTSRATPSRADRREPAREGIVYDRGVDALRCPFCHEDLAAGAEDGVGCAACGAPHHAACFAEAGRCAATGCDSPSARVAGVVLPAARLGEPGALAAARARGARWSAVRAVAGLVAAAAAIAAGIVAGWLGVFGVLAVALVIGALVATATAPRPGGRAVLGRRRGDEFDPIFGTWQPGGWTPGVFPDATRGFRDELEPGRPRAVRPRQGPAPATCPNCAGSLLDDEGRPDPELAFCFHCGLELPGASEPEQAEPPPAPERETGGKPLPRKDFLKE